MKILVASDKFKGSMTAAQACASIQEGLEMSGGDHEIRCVPVADGGDGMASAITSAKSGEWKEIEVSGPLGEKVSAGFGLIDHGRTAVIEMAEASGLALIEGRILNPWRASTYGTGEMLRYVVEKIGVEKVILGIGGSATNDGGTGMAAALGFLFLGGNKEPVTGLPDGLDRVRSITQPCLMDDFPSVTVACDVTNPLLGPEGCTRIYGAQKGIGELDFLLHEKRLEHLVDLAGDAGKSAAIVPGSGAAGGLGFGCLFFLNAELVPGFDLVADVLDLEKHIQWADYVITGEGKMDGQSLQGKAPVGVARLAKKHRKRVSAFCGIKGDVDFSAFFDEVIELERGERDIEQSMRDGFALLKRAASRLL